jgi:hypothetical protein
MRPRAILGKTEPAIPMRMDHPSSKKQSFPEERASGVVTVLVQAARAFPECASTRPKADERRTIGLCPTLK